MKKVLITGASRGIGAETARLFAENHDFVFINYYRSKEKAEELYDKFKKKNLHAEMIRADVSDSEQVKFMFREIEKNHGGIDILINNAGIAQTKLFTDITDEDWHKMIDSNLSSVFYCCRAALPYMIRQKYGRIINISSMWGQIGGSCEVHYSAAKAGIIGLTKALANEEGLSGITVNCIAPGVIKTDMTANLSEEDFQALAQETPVNQIGTPHDIARVAFFLAERASDFITGQVIGVNGGFVM